VKPRRPIKHQAHPPDSGGIVRFGGFDLCVKGTQEHFLAARLYLSVPFATPHVHAAVGTRVDVGRWRWSRRHRRRRRSSRPRWHWSVLRGWDGGGAGGVPDALQRHRWQVTARSHPWPQRPRQLCCQVSHADHGTSFAPGGGMSSEISCPTSPARLESRYEGGDAVEHATSPTVEWRICERSSD